MKIAHYKTKIGATKYAVALASRHSNQRFEVVPSNNFGFNVRVYLPSRPINSTPILAGKRPVNFSNPA